MLLKTCDNQGGLLRLSQALSFLEELDKLKDTYRKCLIMSGKREESTAEHSFSLAMAVLVMSQLSNNPIDEIKTLKMALFHDIGEALAGDTFHYEKSAGQSEAEREALKEVLSSIKDSDLEKDIFDLWEEFETGNSNEAMFLRGIDRFLPMYHNYKTQGHSWVKHGITMDQALEKNAHIAQGSSELWSFTKKMLAESKANGWLG